MPTITNPEHYLDLLKRSQIKNPRFMYRSSTVNGRLYQTKNDEQDILNLTFTLLPSGLTNVLFARTGPGTFEGRVVGYPDLTLDQNFFKTDWKEKLDERLPKITSSADVSFQETRERLAVKASSEVVAEIFRCELSIDEEAMAAELDDDALNTRRAMKYELVVRPAPTPYAVPYAAPPVPVPLPPPRVLVQPQVVPQPWHPAMSVGTPNPKLVGLVFTLEVSAVIKVDVPTFEEAVRKMEFHIYDGLIH